MNCSARDWPTVLPRAYDTPFDALRVAQLRALGLDLELARIVAWHMLPPTPYADAGGERMLLDAVRFLGFIDTNGLYLEVICLGYDRLADIGFFLQAQLRAAEARGQPLRAAFSFSGRTVESVARLAAQHRRDALVAAVAEAMGGGTGSFVRERDVAGIWRAPLTWDEECDKALALRCARVGGDPLRTQLHERWQSSVVLTLARAKSATLHGEWHMRRLTTWAAIHAEGKEQYNCLKFSDHRFLSLSCDSSYWSLRFTPDAATEALVQVNAQLCESVEQLRLTVHVEGGAVAEALARSDAAASPVALKALAAWGRRVAVRVPQYTGSMDRDEAAI